MLRPRRSNCGPITGQYGEPLIIPRYVVASAVSLRQKGYPAFQSDGRNVALNAGVNILRQKVPEYIDEIALRYRAAGIFPSSPFGKRRFPTGVAVSSLAVFRFESLSCRVMFPRRVPLRPRSRSAPAAIGNAIYDTTGARLRDVPFTPVPVIASAENQFIQGAYLMCSPDWIRECPVACNVPDRKARPSPAGCFHFPRVFLRSEWRR